MKRNKIALAGTALFVIGALALAGCASGGNESNGDAGGNVNADAIITTNGSEPENPLIPTNTNEVGGGKILDEIFAGLIYYDAEGKPVNDVAEEITTEDPQNLTIKIKEGLTFTDGEEVTADNFIKAWNEGAKLSNGHLSSYFFEDIEGFSYDEDSELTGLKQVDDYTFTIALNKPASDFALRLGYSAFYPLPDVAFEDMDAFGQNPIGNGPYKIADEDAWQHDVQIELVRNDDYDGGRKAANGGLTIKFYATQEAAYADLLSNEVDVIDAIPTNSLAVFTDELGDRAVNQPSAVFQSFTIGQFLPHFSGEEGKLRRQALSMAINRDEITETIFSGSRTPAKDFTSPVIAGWSDSVPGQRGPRLRPREGEGAVGRGRRHRPVGGHVQDCLQRRRRTRRMGRRCEQQHQEHPGHRRIGRPVPDLPGPPVQGQRPHHHHRRTFGMAGRLPGSVQLPRTALRDRRRFQRR